MGRSKFCTKIIGYRGVQLNVQYSVRSVCLCFRGCPVNQSYRSSSSSCSSCVRRTSRSNASDDQQLARYHYLANTPQYMLEYICIYVAKSQQIGSSRSDGRSTVDNNYGMHKHDCPCPPPPPSALSPPFCTARVMTLMRKLQVLRGCSHSSNTKHARASFIVLPALLTSTCLTCMWCYPHTCGMHLAHRDICVCVCVFVCHRCCHLSGREIAIACWSCGTFSTGTDGRSPT